MKCLAILVNYRCAGQLVDAARSLADDPACDRIDVVDNSEDTAEADWLRAHLPVGVQLSVSERNLGFASACNLAFAADDSDCVLLLNPDARLLPGALARLKETLAENPRLGGVGPRVFWDDECRFLLPPTTFPSPGSYLWDRLALHFPALGEWRAARFRARALHEWRAASPLRVNALSGGHVLLRRVAVEAAGGLFDPAFFMYWEDSDLMCRLASADFALCLEPRARAIHHYAHSPGKDALIGRGWAAYAAKHFSTRGWRLFERSLRRLPVPAPAPADPVILRDAGQAIEIVVPEALWTGWVLEYSPAPSFVPAIGHFGTGPVARLPAMLAARFSGRDFFLRLGDDDGRFVSRYTVRDSVPTG